MTKETVRYRSLAEIIREQALRNGKSVAFSYREEHLTFEALDLKSRKMAAALKTLGVKRQDRVGVLLPRGLEVPVAIYSILTMGAVLVPLDLQSPPMRIASIIEKCGIRHLITGPLSAKVHAVIQGLEMSNLQGLLSFEKHETLPSITWTEIDSLEPMGMEDPVTEDELAYIIFSSGSTGLPKGITHTHKSALAYVRLSGQLYNLTLSDRIANFAPLHFDQSTFGYFTAPAFAATTIILDEASLKVPVSLTKELEKHRVSILYTVPTAFMRMESQGQLEDRNLTTVRWVLFGGESYPIEEIRKLSLRLPNATFSNVYGPAEVNQCTFFNFRELPDHFGKIPLGAAWDETDLLLVDDNDNEMASVGIGELCVHSSTMMLGYWDQQELTAEKILTRHVNASLRQYYRTGDLVERDTEGSLFFVGRKDRQVKIRGMAVELDDIEYYLRKISFVFEAAAFVEKDNFENKISAVVVIKDEPEEFERAIRRELRSCLPIHSIPPNIRVVPALPRNVNGKVDYQALGEGSIEV